MNVKLPVLTSPRQTVSHPGALPPSSNSARQLADNENTAHFRRAMVPTVTPSSSTTAAVVPPLALPGPPPSHGSSLVPVPNVVSPRPLGTKVPLPLATAVQKRIRMLDNHVSQRHVNPIAAWPSTTTQLQSTTNNGAMVTFGGGGGAANRAPLAIELENFMRREHRDLAATKPHASELDSLPIYREAFGCLISHFPEYSATLSLIKAQYDAAVEELSFAAQRAVKLDMDNRSMKATFNLQFVEERESMSSCLHDTQNQLQAALRTNQQQRQQILKLEHDLVTMESAHSQRDKQFEESQERIKMLGITLVEEGTKMAQVVRQNHIANTEVQRLQVLADSLRSSLGEAEKIIQVFRNADLKPEKAGAASPSGLRGVAGGGSSSSSPRTTASKQLDAAAPRASVKTPLSNAMTPRAAPPERRMTLTNADTDDLKRRVFELECSLESLQHENNQLVKENKRLNFRIARLQSETQRDVLTPRPDWDAVQQRLPGFHAEKNRSSVQQINELLQFVQHRLRQELLENERKGYGEIVWRWLEDEGIAESELMHVLRYFIPRGTAPTVPSYLQTARPVRNRRLNKGDVEAILHQFWTARQVRRKTVPCPSVEEYWTEWANKETGSQDAAVELSYNILDICERWQHDPDCRLFLKVLRGELSELAVYDQTECVQCLQQTCQAQRMEGTRSMITRAAFLRAIREVFPEKPLDHMTKLRFLLATWSTDEVFDYEILFAEDSDGNQTPFMEMLRRQHAFEVEAFTVDVCETIRQIAKPETGMVNVADAMNAIHELDPYLPEITIQSMFSTGCRITITDLLAAPRTLETALEPLVQRLKFHTLLKRMSPPVDHDGDAEGREEDVEIDSSAWQARANKILEDGV